VGVGAGVLHFVAIPRPALYRTVGRIERDNRWLRIPHVHGYASIATRQHTAHRRIAMRLLHSRNHLLGGAQAIYPGRSRVTRYGCLRGHSASLILLKMLIVRVGVGDMGACAYT